MCFKILAILILLLQENLVPNSSFEEYKVDHCGLTVSVKQFSADNYSWMSPTFGHPNIYSKNVKHHCWNYIDGESPDQPRTGDRMLMICNFGSGGFRSYAQVALKTPLQKSMIYTIRFWVRVPRNSKTYSPSLGALFTTTAGVYKTSMRIEEIPTVEFEDWRPLEWVRLEKTFRAEDEYNYLTIGNFRENSETKLVELTSEKVERPTCWIYLDDVELFRE